MAASHQPELPVGTVLDSKFRITREVGRGGMAVVYEAVHIEIGKRVAVKLLSQDLVTSKVVRERFLREARAAAAIRSPHICEVYDSGMFAERPFLVMELLEGESLYERLSRVRRLDPTTTLNVIEQTARGLHKAHLVGVVHRDLKPENIFLTQDEEGRLLVKLVDFGLAKFYEADTENVRLTREGALFGTPAYMSPEQAKGLGGVDHRADLWALGCIVYECLTGKTVWNVEQGVAMILAQIAAAPLPKPSAQFSDLPPSFDDWFGRALNRVPELRFQTPRELADSLAAALLPPSLHPEHISDTDLAPPVAPIASFAPISSVGSPDPKVALPAVPPAPDAPPARTGSAWAMRLVLGTLAVTLAGYFVWLFVLEPKTARSGAEPLENAPYALKVNAAQLSLGDDNPELALKRFQEAFNLNQAPVARSLLQRCEIIVEQSRDSANRCRVTGLGRPRPFDVVKPVSRPSLAVTAQGPVVAWADNHADSTKRQVSSVLLDEALRRVSVPRTLSPEAVAVGDPTLLSLNSGIATLYADSAGDEPGLSVRAWALGSEALSASTRLTATKRYPFSAGAAQAPKGDLWFVWEESNPDGSVSLLVRQLSADFSPAGLPVRVATLAPRFRPGATRGITKPALAVTDSELLIVFALETTPARAQIMQLLIQRTDPKLGEGVLGEAARALSEEKPEDLHLGRLSAVSETEGKNAQPQLDCSESGECYVAWDMGTDNANIAYLTLPGGRTVWRRSLSKAGSRPTIAHSKTTAAVVWFEDSRLKIASVSNAGIGPASILTRVTGFQPHPAVAAGQEPGTWYIAWRDFEAGHLEAFVLRTQCQ